VAARRRSYVGPRSHVQLSAADGRTRAALVIVVIGRCSNPDFKLRDTKALYPLLHHPPPRHRHGKLVPLPRRIRWVVKSPLGSNDWVAETSCPTATLGLIGAFLSHVASARPWEEKSPPVESRAAGASVYRGKRASGWLLQLLSTPIRKSRHHGGIPSSTARD